MIHKISINQRIIEVFFAEDGYIEIYETKKPSKTGFILKNIKELNLLINNLTDIAEKHQED